jgi:hypothetical protein
MATMLTEDQLRAAAAQPNEPLRLLDPSTNRSYVLVPSDVYDRYLTDFHAAETYPALDRAFADGWNDPKMDDYDRYEELKR